MKFLKKIKYKNGFTLIEALVSVALVLIAVIGPLSLTLNSVTTIIQSKNKVIASYLGEEVIENFRNYRDSFSMACSNIDINYTDDGQSIIDGACVGNGANLYISPTYFLDALYSPSSIAWQLFSNSVDPLLINGESYLDNESFSYTLSSIYSIPSCDYLNLSENKGYNCTSGSKTPFRRSIFVSKISNNALRVRVKVIYLESGIFGLNDKSVEVTDYIYQR
ncbi:MAG: hypothetical protein RI945_301 [Candidatus Parcubacteria bacterium]|jgi:type II secretory pathway pseudopilin PulG